MDPLSCYHFELDEEGQLDCRCIYVMLSVISYNGAIILQLASANDYNRCAIRK